VDESRKNVMAFEEKPSNPKSTLISTGCSILPASVLPILTTFAKKHPDNVGGIFEELLRQNMPIECFTFSDPWFDIGSFDAYLEATKVLVGNLVLSEESATHENTDTEGSIVIGKGSSVNRSTLTDTVIFEDCIVEDCVLHSCILDHHCVLRGIDLTGKMLREGTNLEQKA
jgi:glucose-1-phosphate thymidylyltransferase